MEHAVANEDALDLISTEDPTRLASWGSRYGRAIARNPYSPLRFDIYNVRQKTSMSPVWQNDLEAEILSLGTSQQDGLIIDTQPTCFAGLPDLSAIERRYGDRVLPGSDAQQAHDERESLERDWAALDMRPHLCRCGRLLPRYARAARVRYPSHDRSPPVEHGLQRVGHERLEQHADDW